MKQLIQRLKRLKDDERAVSPVVGFVLIFALIMIVFTIYQSSVVPVQNEKVEYQNSQTIEGQMGQLSSAIVDTSSTGEPRSVTLNTGVQYPTRAFAINPGNPVGTLETIDTKGVTLSGLKYGNGTHTFPTSFISYRPNYIRMSEETQYSLENGMFLKHYSSSDTVGLESGGSMFSGDGNVNLVLMTGNLHTQQMTTTVTTEHVYTRTINSSALDSATVTLPTTLPEDQWKKDILNGTSHTIQNYDDSGAINRITIDLGSNTELRVSTISPGGSDSSDVPETKRYIQNETSLKPNVTVDTPASLTVSVHDQFGSPLTSNVTLKASTTGAGSLNTTNATPDVDGKATFDYVPSQSDSGKTVKVTVDLQGGSENGPVTFELHYPAEDSAPNGSNREPINVAKGSLESGPTDLIFRITPGSPIDVTGFSVKTKDSLASLNETARTHAFEIYTTKYVQGQPGSASGLHYSSSEPIQFDGGDYTFEGGPLLVASSEIHLKKFDQADGITFTGFTDSYRTADIILYFILADGTKRPVYITGTMNPNR